MMETALTVLSALGLFEALRLLLGDNDLLRLRTMARLALSFSLAAMSLGPAVAISIATGLAACRLHPDLRSRPALPLMLLMLTPMAAVCAAMAALRGIDWPPADAFVLDVSGYQQGMIAVAFAAPLHPAIGFGWRMRVLAASALCAAFVHLPGGGYEWATLIPVYAAAAGIALRGQDFAALRRTGYAIGVFAFAPLLVLAAQAGPWTQAAGEELLIARTPLTTGGDADGVYALQTYSESGLADGYTFIASAFQETARNSTKMGGMAGLRAKLFEDDGWVVSGEASAGVEPFSLNAGTGGWERHVQAELTASAGWGGSVDGFPVYASAGIGWRFRPEEFGDAALLSVSGGIDLAPDIQLNIHASTDINTSGESSRFGQAALLWRIDEAFALEAGVQSFHDQNGDTGAQVFAGVWVRF